MSQIISGYNFYTNISNCLHCIYGVRSFFGNLMEEVIFENFYFFYTNVSFCKNLFTLFRLSLETSPFITTTVTNHTNIVKTYLVCLLRTYSNLLVHIVKDMYVFLVS